jgi:hypothetical protein
VVSRRSAVGAFAVGLGAVALVGGVGFGSALRPATLAPLQPAPSRSTRTPAVLSPVPTSTSRPGSRCVLGGFWPLYEPDSTCTPGSLNPQVTQANIGSTICSPGWSTKQREAGLSRDAAHRAKVLVAKAYGLDVQFDQAELDHRVPISLGGDVGSLTQLTNLWLEPGATLNRKDTVEITAGAEVCKRHLLLATAQQAFMSPYGWEALGKRLGVPIPEGDFGG